MKLRSFKLDHNISTSLIFQEFNIIFKDHTYKCNIRENNLSNYVFSVSLKRSTREFNMIIVKQWPRKQCTK